MQNRPFNLPRPDFSVCQLELLSAFQKKVRTDVVIAQRHEESTVQFAFLSAWCLRGKHILRDGDLVKLLTTFILV